MVAFLAFCPKILAGDEDLQIFFLFENECSLNSVDTQTPLAGKKKISLMQWGCKNFAILPSSLALSLALSLVHHTSHLVKLSLPNIMA